MVAACHTAIILRYWKRQVPDRTEPLAPVLPLLTDCLGWRLRWPTAGEDELGERKLGCIPVQH